LVDAGANRTFRAESKNLAKPAWEKGKILVKLAKSEQSQGLAKFWQRDSKEGKILAK
jgi:hypothetical protein